MKSPLTEIQTQVQLCLKHLKEKMAATSARNSHKRETSQALQPRCVVLGVVGATQVALKALGALNTNSTGLHRIMQGTLHSIPACPLRLRRHVHFQSWGHSRMARNSAKTYIANRRNRNLEGLVLLFGKQAGKRKVPNGTLPLQKENQKTILGVQVPLGLAFLVFWPFGVGLQGKQKGSRPSWRVSVF